MSKELPIIFLKEMNYQCLKPSATIPLTLYMYYPEKSRITVDVSKSGRMQENVCRMINIGSVHSLLSKQYQKALASCQLGFEYIRIQEVISSSFIPRILPDYDYYFQNADTVLSFLYQNNLIRHRFCPAETSDQTILSRRLHRRPWLRLLFFCLYIRRHSGKLPKRKYPAGLYIYQLKSICPRPGHPAGQCR